MTEVLYLLNFSFIGQEAALEFVLSGAVTLVPSNIESLDYVKKIMKKYQDFPMDFADATLVSAANDLLISNILTFDVKHFNAYRYNKTKSFTIFPFNS